MMKGHIDILVYPYKGLSDSLSKIKDISVYDTLYSVNSGMEYMYALNFKNELLSEKKILFHGSFIDEGFIKGLDFDYSLEGVIVNPVDSTLLIRDSKFDTNQYIDKVLLKVTDPVSKFYIRIFPSLIDNYFDLIGDQAYSILNSFNKVYKYGDLIKGERTVEDFNFILGNDFEADYRIYNCTYNYDGEQNRELLQPPIYYNNLLVGFLNIKDKTLRAKLIDSMSSSFLKSILELHNDKSEVDLNQIYNALEVFTYDKHSEDEILNILYFLEHLFDRSVEGIQSNNSSSNWAIQFCNFLMMSPKMQLDAIEQMDSFLQGKDSYKLLITRARFNINVKKDFIAAEKNVLNAVKIQALKPNAYKLLIKIYQKLDSYDALISSYEKCLELLPKNKKLTLKYFEQYHSALK